ncbi:hypothetical protein BN946_scf184601.g16 [Trametes cinnabarina]|uniref:Uncharacterized protein n=1 Tax=Pycnoporus cinnabarinus TaxID=5643 RepID=A0A060SCE5_PYCCI|nr:hypothetical protein BN946_scf184601.g16 [Trametes cinnabarina]
MQVSFTFLRFLSLALVTAHLSGAVADSSSTLHNITVDDTDGSPDGLYKVIYSPPDAWKAGSAKGCDGCLVSDIDTSKLQNGTWHEAAYDATHPQQITATVLFNGTGVWIYGLLPHTNLSATNDVYFHYAIDSPLTSGFVNATAEHGNIVNNTAAVDYDVFLFGVSALNASRPHNVTLLVGSGGNPRSTQGSDSPVLSSIFLLDYVVIMYVVPLCPLPLSHTSVSSMPVILRPREPQTDL